MGQISFSQAIYLALTGKLPSPEVGQVLDAIFVASIDHGATPPSALAARTSASTGAPFNAAVAAGLLSINKYHGGAVEDCMRMIQMALDIAKQKICIAGCRGGSAGRRLSRRKEAPAGLRASHPHRRSAHQTPDRTCAGPTGVAGAAVAMVQAIGGCDGAVGANAADQCRWRDGGGPARSRHPAGTGQHLLHDCARAGAGRACLRRNDPRTPDAPHPSRATMNMMVWLPERNPEDCQLWKGCHGVIAAGTAFGLCYRTRAGSEEAR